MLTEWIAIGLTAVSLLGTMAVLVLNLKVSAAIANLRSDTTATISSLKSDVARDLGHIELEVAKSRTDAANDRAAFEDKILTKMTNMFANRETSEIMHRSNTTRLEAIERRLETIDARLASNSHQGG